MKPWVALPAVLVVAGGVAFGVNIALGDPPTPQIIPKEPQPESTPPPFPPDATPVIGLHHEPRVPVCNWPDPDAPPQPFELNEPCFTDPNAEVPEIVPLPGEEGKLFPLPPEALVSSVISEPVMGSDPEDFGGWPLEFDMVQLGNSWIRFTYDGVILDSHVEPQDAQALQPFLEQLEPRPYFNLPDGRRIPLPSGVSFAAIYPGPLVGQKYPSDYPLFFMMVETGNSWVHFIEDGVIIGSHIEPQDAETLQPVIEQLRAR